MTRSPTRGPRSLRCRRAMVSWRSRKARSTPLNWNNWWPVQRQQTAAGGAGGGGGSGAGAAREFTDQGERIAEGFRAVPIDAQIVKREASSWFPTMRKSSRPAARLSQRMPKCCKCAARPPRITPHCSTTTRSRKDANSDLLRPDQEALCRSKGRSGECLDHQQQFRCRCLKSTTTAAA